MIPLMPHLFKKSEPVADDSTDEQWKWFKGCLGALDGTHIRIRVPLEDQPRYRNRKGEITTNVLGVCSRDGQFVYVMAGWEGSAADSRVLQSTILKPNGLKVPEGQYYLVDAGFTNGPGFLAPYRGQRYHLNLLFVLFPQLIIIMDEDSGSSDTVATVYELANASRFGWDPVRKCVYADDAVWNQYTQTHPKAVGWRHKAFPHYDELTKVWAKDRATSIGMEDTNDI
ncbi:protein ALP1-like [Senna tora]|uniref:Protein ALP1-like n=1 Tax=Senna tora TaxID=362788 RepID=A0A834XA89_9FABA|nr:protein ALP1-like [Senna tora]